MIIYIMRYLQQKKLIKISHKKLQLKAGHISERKKSGTDQRIKPEPIQEMKIIKSELI